MSGSSSRDDAAWPQVTVIMPTRGRPELVRKSIAAVVAQSYPGDIDCIVVHDQEPPDEELPLMGTAQHQVRVVANARTPGLAGARNTGLDLAKSDYIASCDDDDVWHPDKLLVQMRRLLDEPSLLVLGSGIRLCLPGGKTLDWPGRAEEVSYDLLLRNRVKELHSSTLVMRRDAFAKAGSYDEEVPYGYAEDYDWVLRAARAGRVGLVTQPLADIRRNGTSFYQGEQRRRWRQAWSTCWPSTLTSPGRGGVTRACSARSPLRGPRLVSGGAPSATPRGLSSSGRPRLTRLSR